ncbi:MAG: ABC transporter permease [Candidatus Bathyarchaeia archaeon]
MPGIGPILRKELADHLSSKRFPLVFALVFLSGMSTAYLGAQAIEKTPGGEVEQALIFLRLFTGAPSPAPSFIYFMGLFGPIIGMALGFDAINREISSGSLLRILSNPVHRDAIINGKIVAGMVTIALIISSVVGTIVGYDILVIGFGPTLDATSRILYFIFTSTLYVGLWMGVSLLLSVVFKRVTTSTLACLALWVFFNFFIYMIAQVVAELVVPLRPYFPYAPLSLIMAHEEVRLLVSRLSPTTLYVEVANVVLNPEIKSLGPIYLLSRDLPTPRPLSLDESIILAWPNISALLAGLVTSITLSYVIFMRREIKPTWA